MPTYYSPRIVTDGLVLCLDAGNTKSYSGSGTVWNDLSGNGNSGTLINSPNFDNLNVGSILFDGIDDYGTTPFLGSFTSFTIDVWFTTKQFPSSNQYPAVICNIFNGSLVNYAIGWSFTNINTFFVGYYNGAGGLGLNGWRMVSNISVDLNTPTNITMVYDNNLLSAYKNGVFFNSIVPNLTPNGVIGSYIGRRWDFANYFNGNINFISKYNRGLNNLEIQNNYNALKGRFGL